MNRRPARAALLAKALAVLPGAPLAGAEPQPAAGKLLVAKERLRGPNFARTMG